MGLKKGDRGTGEQYNTAHKSANKVQDMVQGNEVIINKRQGLNKTFLESNGTKTNQKVQLQDKNGPLKHIKVTKSKVD